MEKDTKVAFQKSVYSFSSFMPMLFGILLLVSYLLVTIPTYFYSKIFSGNIILDSFLGAILGSVSTGNPITSYVLGGEFLEQGVSIVAVTAFLLAWVSVGLVQLPVESTMLGKRFAIVRNVVSFAMAIIIAVLTALTLTFI